METSGSLATPGIKRPLSQYLCLKSRTNPFHKCARARTLPNKHACRANLVRSVFGGAVLYGGENASLASPSFDDIAAKMSSKTPRTIASFGI